VPRYSWFDQQLTQVQCTVVDLGSGLDRESLEWDSLQCSEASAERCGSTFASILTEDGI
jgi:hypothetical protein